MFSARKLLQDPRLQLSAANLTSQVVLMGMTPWYTRLFSTSDFGQSSVMLFFIQIISVTAALRYDLALLNAKTDAIAARLVRLSTFLIIGVCSVALAAIVLAVAVWPTPTVEMANIFLVPVGILLISLFTLLNYWFTRQNSFSLMAGARVFQTAVGAVAPLIMHPFGYGVAALVVGAVLARSAGLLIYLIAIKRLPRLFKEMGRGSRAPNKQVMTKFVSFPLFSAPQVLVNTAAMAVAPVIMTMLGDQDLGGQMWAADRIMLSGMAIFGVSYGQVLLGQLKGASAPHQVKGPVLANHISLLKFGPAMIVLAGLVLFLFAQELLGQKWNRAGEIAFLLIFPAVAQLLSSPLSVIVGLLGKNKENLFFHLFALIARAVPFAILCAVNVDLAIPVYAAITVLTYGIYLVYLLKLASIGWDEYFAATRIYWLRFALFAIASFIVTFLAMNLLEV